MSKRAGLVSRVCYTKFRVTHLFFYPFMPAQSARGGLGTGGLKAGECRKIGTASFSSVLLAVFLLLAPKNTAFSELKAVFLGAKSTSQRLKTLGIPFADGR